MVDLACRGCGFTLEWKDVPKYAVPIAEDPRERKIKCPECGSEEFDNLDEIYEDDPLIK